MENGVSSCGGRLVRPIIGRFCGYFTSGRSPLSNGSVTVSSANAVAEPKPVASAVKPARFIISRLSIIRFLRSLLLTPSSSGRQRLAFIPFTKPACTHESNREHALVEYALVRVSHRQGPSQSTSQFMCAGRCAAIIPFELSRSPDAAQQAPGIPHALHRAKDKCTTRAHRAARSRSNVWNWSRHRHSGAMRSIEPGISRFRVWSCGPSRNDGVWIATSLRAKRSNPFFLSLRLHGLLRFARNDGVDGLTQTASSAKAWSPKRHRGKPSMKKFIRTAIDLGKTYFQVHGLESEAANRSRVR